MTDFRSILNTCEYVVTTLDDPPTHADLTQQRIAALTEDPQLLTQKHRYAWEQLSDQELHYITGQMNNTPILMDHEYHQSAKLLSYLPNHRKAPNVSSRASFSTPEFVRGETSADFVVSLAAVDDPKAPTLHGHGHQGVRKHPPKPDVDPKHHRNIGIKTALNPIPPNCDFTLTQQPLIVWPERTLGPAQVLGRVTGHYFQSVPKVRCLAHFQLYDNAEGVDACQNIESGRTQCVSIGHMRRVGMEHLHTFRTDPSVLTLEEISLCVLGREKNTRLQTRVPIKSRIRTPAHDAFTPKNPEFVSSRASMHPAFIYSKGHNVEDEKTAQRTFSSPFEKIQSLPEMSLREKFQDPKYLFQSSSSFLFSPSRLISMASSSPPVTNPVVPAPAVNAPVVNAPAVNPAPAVAPTAPAVAGTPAATGPAAAVPEPAPAASLTHVEETAKTDIPNDTVKQWMNMRGALHAVTENGAFTPQQVASLASVMNPMLGFGDNLVKRHIEMEERERPKANQGFHAYMDLISSTAGADVAQQITEATKTFGPQTSLQQFFSETQAPLLLAVDRVTKGRKRGAEESVASLAATETSSKAQTTDTVTVSSEPVVPPAGTAPAATIAVLPQAESKVNSIASVPVSPYAKAFNPPPKAFDTYMAPGSDRGMFSWTPASVKSKAHEKKPEVAVNGAAAATAATTGTAAVAAKTEVNSRASSYTRMPSMFGGSAENPSSFATSIAGSPAQLSGAALSEQRRQMGLVN